MGPKLLHHSATVLLDQLTEHLEDPRGLGFMSPAIYDTAWVSMIQKDIGEQTTWLFPECFEYVLQNQLEDGSWITYSSEIDGILNTAASLLSMKRHFTTPFQITAISQDALSERIDRATNALQRLLHNWDVNATLHVGFEILVPALLGYLADESIVVDFPGRDLLFTIRDQKLARFKAEFLYAPIQTTAIHSLEAFIGLIDFDRVLHHKVNGSYMASPSSTAAVLIYASAWDDECEEYLRHVIRHASGKGSGGVPSAFPSTIFEITWTLSTLLKAGFDFISDSSTSTQQARTYLYDALIAGQGTLGFVPHVCADADDTAKAVLVLNLLQSQVSPDAMLKAFETDHHFRTYPHERDPSFSANCNVLMALLHVEEPSLYTSQIEKASTFLHKHFRESPGLQVQDKWNLSPLYSWMLMAQAISRLHYLCQSNQLLSLRNFLEEELMVLLRDMTVSILHQQNQNGSWSTRNSKEETAYAVLMLTYAVQCDRPDISHQEIRVAVQKGCAFLTSDTSLGSERLWVEKVTYESKVLSQAYILAALNNAADLHAKVASEPLAVTTTGVNGHHAENSIQANGANGIYPNCCNKDVLATNGVDISVPEPVSIMPEALPIVEVVKSEHQLNGNGHEQNLKPTSIHLDDIPRPHRRIKWTEEQEQILLGPFDYLESLPGKNMRSKFIQAFNTWLQVPPAHLEIVETVISMLHTASLLVDDIEDSSVLRRGQPVAHSIFGVAQTFNSGNYVYFLALREIQKLNNPRVNEIYIDALIQLHRGQGMDVFWRDSLICPTEQEYLDMVANKTGALFGLAINLLQLGSTVTAEFTPLVQQFGMIFQICDDYLNLKSTSYLQKKGLCEDLTEGKFSFPIIHSIRANPGNRQLINVLKQKSQDEDLKRFAVSYMETTKTFEYTRNFVRGLRVEASDMIDNLEKQGLGENLEIRKLLARMSLDGL